MGSDSAVFPQQISSGAQLYLGKDFDHRMPTTAQVWHCCFEMAMILLIPVQVASGWQHNAGVENGRLWSWGWGGSVGSDSAVFPQHTSSGGQLGLGNEFDYWKPTAVQDLTDEEGKRLPASSWGALHVSCGLNHTAAIVKL